MNETNVTEAGAAAPAERPWVLQGFVDVVGFFVRGPKTEWGWVLWGLLFPITFTTLAVSQIITAYIVAMCGCVSDGMVSSELMDKYDAASGYGSGFFDEVSDRRRADLDFMFGNRY